MIKRLCNYLLFLILGAMLFAPTLSYACSCRGETDLKSRFIRAQDVVIAEVMDTKLVKTVHKEHDLEYIVADIQVIKNFKQDEDNGLPPAQVIDLVPETGNCSIALISGMEYVFFVDDKHYQDEESEIGWLKQDNYVGRCTGSHIANIYSVDFKAELAELKKLSNLNDEGKLKAHNSENNGNTPVQNRPKLNN